MEHLVKYLLAPLQTGVYYGQFMADFFNIVQLFREVGTKIAKKYESDSKDLIKAADNIKEFNLEFIDLEELIEYFDK